MLLSRFIVVIRIAKISFDIDGLKPREPLRYYLSKSTKHFFACMTVVIKAPRTLALGGGRVGARENEATNQRVRFARTI